MTNLTTPTEELYLALQSAYEHFNGRLFAYELPHVLFTTQRQKGMMGCFFPNRWAASGSNSKKCHEIAINPLYVSRATLIELMQTLVHEMVHCWQYCYGNPSRGSYHNREWSDKMISIGLMPSSTGAPGGKVVGQNMSDYPAPNGKFIKECVNLLKEKRFNVPWIDRFAISQGMLDIERLNQCGSTIATALNNISEGIVNQLTTKIDSLLGEQNGLVESIAKPINKIKRKYSCPGCKINVWGKNGLQLRCESCDLCLS